MKTRATDREGGWDRRDWQRAPRLAELALVCAASCLFGLEAASGAGSVQLAWDRNTEPDIASYRVYYGTSSRVYSQWLDAGNVTNTTVTSLASQTSYYFAVTAWNTAGRESDYSNEVVHQTPATGLVDPVINWANPADIVYGTPLGAGQLNATAGVPGTFTYSPAAGTVLPAGPGQTLSVTFTPTDTANYNTVTAKATLNVTEAPLVITALSQAKVYGAAVPPLTASCAGFVNGDTPASLSTPVSLGTVATAASHVGTYAIVAGGATSPNYAISFVNGCLTITPANLAITANNKSMPKGSAVPTLTASYSGFVNGDSPSSLATPVVLATTATPNSPAGTYPITATGATSSDYSITQVNGVLTVTPAALVSIAVTEATNTITVGQSQQATATGTYTDGTSQDVSTAAAWLSSVPSVATVNSAGLVNALAVGNTVISASLSGVEGSVALAVVASAPVTYTNTVVFTQSKAITIPAIGAATPYPSTIQVSGLAGTVQKVCVTLHSFSHTAPKDVKVLLVSPANNKCLLMASCGGTRAVTGVALTFDDAATASLPNSSQIKTGTYRPTFYGNSPTLPSPAPAGPYVSSLSAINGTSPVGTWSLYVADGAAKNSGSLYSGWSLTITTVSTVNSGAGMMAQGLPTPDASEDQLQRPPGVATATSLSLGSIVLLPDGKVRLSARGQPGQAYILQVSTDLVHWWNLSAGVVPSVEFDLVDEPASRGNASFYRLQAENQSPLE